MPGPLEGVRVVDLTVGMAGPVAAMLLADAGADVVKVEPPEGDPARSRPGFHVWNRGKRAVTVALEVEDDRRRLAHLLGAADAVLVGTTQPGLTYQDLGPEGMAAGRASTVWVVMPPYVLGETPWAGGQESAALLFASLGHAWSQASCEDVPVDCVYPVALYMQGIWAATVTAASLLAGDQRMGVTLAVGGAHGAVLISPGGMAVRRGQPHVHRPGGPAGSLANYRCYQCQDGRWIFLGAFTSAFVQRALTAIGAGHVLEDERVGGDPAKVRSLDNFPWISAELDRIFRGRSQDEWVRVLEAADVPVAPVLSRDSWLDHPQVEALGLRVEMRDGAGRDVVMPGVPLQLGGTPTEVAGPAPSAAVPIAEVGEVWPSPSPADAGRPPAGAPWPPLGGIRVLDLGTIIAGPYLASLLGELGAEVIKVERPPHGDEYRVAHGGRGGAGFAVYNRGQRGLALDLQAEPSRSAFGQLLGSSDVLVDNLRPGALGRMGLDWPALADRHPGLISVSISAFGGDVGPLGSRPGFDPVVQALSGIMRAQGGPDEDDIPVFLTVPINDVISAGLGAFGACAALLSRRRTGRGQQVGVTLSGASCLLQSEDLVRVDGRRAGPTGGRDWAGPNPLSRLYRTADGWVRVDGAWPEDLGRVEEAGLLGPPPSSDPASLPEHAEVAARLAATIVGLATEEVLGRTAGVGVAATRARRPAELVDDRVLIDHGLLRQVPASAGPAAAVSAGHEVAAVSAGPAAAVSAGHEVAAVEPGHWLEVPGVDLPVAREAPILGEESVAILAEAGVAPSQLEALMAAGLVVGPAPRAWSAPSERP